MGRLTRLVAVAAASLALWAGCATLPAAREGVPVVVYSADIDQARDYWPSEAARRYDGDFVVVVCHGYTIGNLWFVTPDGRDPLPTTALIREVRQTYPTERLILVVCNSDGVQIDTPNVSYAPNIVWVRPDRWVDPVSNVFRDIVMGNPVGDIHEFLEN